MSQRKIISEQPITLVELEEEVKRIKKRDQEPSFRVIRVEEYLNSFVHLSPKQEKELIEKINAVNIPRLKEEHIKKLVDIMPANIDQLKVVLQGYVVTVNQDNIKKLVGVFKDFIPDKLSE